MKRVELLSPAGDMECLIAAVKNGADAVYIGGKKFGARAFANNFDYEELINAVKYCHLYGVRLFVTVNTICYEEEIEEVLNYIEFLHSNNVDALIMQDLGLISIVRKIFPNLEIHASTQMHNYSDEDLEVLKELGVKRVVLDRELSLDEINKLKTDIEKEVFIHGALCISYSGCCLFSAMHGGRSGNRGECVGACRLPYKLYQDNKEIKANGSYLLSTKSLCTLSNLNEILSSNINALKIEGRMKSPEYVGYITKLYREKIDAYYNKIKKETNEEEITNIKKLYNRELTNGYMFKTPSNDLVNIKTSNHIGIHLGKVISIDKNKIKIKLDSNLNQEDGIRFDNDKGMIVNKLYDSKGKLVNKLNKGNVAVLDNKIDLIDAKEVRKTQDVLLNEEINKSKERKVKIDIKLTAKIGKPLEINITDNINNIVCYGKEVEKSINSPTSKERIKEQLEKLGNTPFISEETTIDMDQNIFLSIKELNDLRRDAIDKLIEKREYYVPNKVIKNKINIYEEINKDKKINLSILVRNEKQLKIALNNKVDRIYTTDYNLYKKYKDKNIYYRLPRVYDNKLNFKNDNLLITELGSIYKYSKNNNVISDYYLNVVNKYSYFNLKDNNVKLVTLSPEVTDETLSIIGNTKGIELIIYGRLELMITKYSPVKKLLNKIDLKSKYFLVDKDKNKYPLEEENNITHILDSKSINLIDNINKYIEYGITNYRLELSYESEKEIENLIKLVRDSYGYKDNK